jgi:glycosyltransferase involved in cell wall biosynthesis
MHEFPELLALRGHDITFMDFDEGRKLWKRERDPRYEEVRGRIHPKARVKLYRPFQLGIPGVDRMLAVFSAVPQMHKLFKNQKFDAVVLYAVPTYGLQAIWFARRHNVPVVFRALDVSHKIRSSIFSSAIRRVEKQIYRTVDLLSANNPAMAAYCASQAKKEIETVVHFPPLDLAHFQGAAKDPKLRKSLGFGDDDLVLVYMGSFFYFSGLSDALREFARISKQDSRLRFLLIGGGELETFLRKLVLKLNIQNQVVFAGFISYQNLPTYLKVADVALNTLEPTLVANVAFPNKVLQYLAAGLPVVSTKLEGLYSVFKPDGSLVWAEDAASAVRAGCHIGREPLGELGTKFSAGVTLEKFSLTEAVNNFESALEKLIQESAQ